jgi:hypothetical protein
MKKRIISLLLLVIMLIGVAMPSYSNSSDGYKTNASGNGTGNVGIPISPSLVAVGDFLITLH